MPYSSLLGAGVHIVAIGDLRGGADSASLLFHLILILLGRDAVLLTEYRDEIGGGGKARLLRDGLNAEIRILQQFEGVLQAQVGNQLNTGGTGSLLE